MADSDRRESDEGSENLKYFRAQDRVARVDDQYWFSTREGEEGPFATRTEAETALRGYIASKQFQNSTAAEPPVIERRRGDPTIWDRQIDII